MDKNGEYIPFCTKMVFLKYYSDSSDNQLHFWSISDMNSYVKFINIILKDYLDGKSISLIKGDVIND